MAYLSNSHRKFAAAAITATLVATAVVPAYAAPYSDVSNRYEEAIGYLIKNNIAQGLTSTSFGTDQSIKRADVAVMVAKALKLDVTAPTDSGFTDVPKRAKNYVDALKAAGIINGKTATSFASNQEITRGEAAMMLAKAFNLKGEKTQMTFTDVSSRYADSVSALVAHEITTGKTKTSFGTTQAITRGEFAIFLHKLSKLEDAAPSYAMVKNETELQTALRNKDIQQILLAESFALSKDLVIERNVELNLNGQTLTGNVNYENSANADIFFVSTKAGGKLAGNLTVNAPNADFTVGENIEITGATTINNVKASTFYNKGVLHSVVIKDNDGASFANKDNGIVLNDVALETIGNVSLIGNINLVTVNQAAKINVSENAAVKKMMFKVNGATVDNFKGKVDVMESLQGIAVKDSYGKLVETKTEYTGSPGIVTTANVKNLEQLEAALANERIKTINLTQNVEGLNKQIKIDRAVNLNGKGFKLQFTEALNTAATSERSGIVIAADKTKISDLNVEMEKASGWQGTYALQVYGAKDVVLHNFTGSGADAALLVNGSAVELTGTTTVEGNEFGGIEVSKGTAENLSVSSLKMTGSIVNTQEAIGIPTIWTVEGEGNVTGNKPVHLISSIKPGQVQYYLSDGPINEFHKELITALGHSFYELVDLDLPLDRLAAPISEVYQEWKALQKQLEKENIAESNQLLLQNTEKNVVSYMTNRMKRFTHFILPQDYTEKSYEELTQAKKTPDPETFGAAIEKAELINDAAAQLVFAGQEEMDQKIIEAQGLKQTDYTTDSFLVLQHALNIEVPETNIETIEKTQLINSAMLALVFAGQAEFDEAFDIAAALKIADYTPESYSGVQLTLDLPKPKNNEELVSKTAKLKKALAELTFAAQADLNTAIAKAEEKKEENYTPASYENLTNAFPSVKPKSNAEALEQEKALNEAMAHLVFASYPTLEQTMIAARELDVQQYTAESFAKLQRALDLGPLTNNQIVEEKNEAIKLAVTKLVFHNQAELDAAIKRGQSHQAEGYTPATFQELQTALGLAEPTTNAEVLAKKDAIEGAIRALEFMAYDYAAEQEARAFHLVKSHYASAGIQALETAMAMPRTTNAETQAKADAIKAAIAELKILAEEAPLLAPITGGRVGSAFDPLQMLPTGIEMNLKDGSKRLIAIADWINIDNYNPQAAGSYTFEAVLKLPKDVEYTGTSVQMEVVIEQLPMSIQSEPILDFNFLSIGIREAILPSKKVAIQSIKGQNKNFIIVMGQERIPVILDNEAIAKVSDNPSLGRIISNEVMEYYLTKYPGLIPNNYREFWVNYSDRESFALASRQKGQSYSISVKGTDWNYFFDTNYAQGISNHSKNKSITINDGFNSATYNTVHYYANIEAMIYFVNQALTSAGVQARAVKVNNQQFEIVATKVGIELEISGPDKAYFFGE